MGFFKPKTVAPPVEKVDEEKTQAAKKQRLLETQGGNQGAELASSQGKSVRRVFGT